MCQRHLPFTIQIRIFHTLFLQSLTQTNTVKIKTYRHRLLLYLRLLISPYLQDGLTGVLGSRLLEITSEISALSLMCVMIPSWTTLLIQVVSLHTLLSLRRCQLNQNFLLGILGGEVMALPHIFSRHGSLPLLARNFLSSIPSLVRNGGQLVRSLVTYVVSLEEATTLPPLL